MQKVFFYFINTSLTIKKNYIQKLSLEKSIFIFYIILPFTLILIEIICTVSNTENKMKRFFVYQLL
jgi:hypothetical protein